MMTDEVECGQHRLVTRSAQTATQLLKEYRRALGGPQEQDGVDIGQVETFVEQVGCEEHVDSSRAQVIERTFTSGLRSASADGAGRDACPGEDGCHELRMGDVDAEAEGSHAAEVHHLVAQLGQHDRRPGVIAGVDVGQGRVVVAPLPPGHRPEVGAVGDTEVVERAQQVGAQRLPQSKLGRRATVEERAYVDPVGALGRCRESDELARCEMVDQPPVGRRLSMVELVDDHDVVGVGWDVVDAVGGQRLDAGEDVPPALGSSTTDIELAERGVREDLPVGAQRLLEDLPAVCDEEERRAVRGLVVAQPAVVEGGDHCLAGAGRGNDQVAVAVVDGALDVQRLQHLLLVGVGTDFQPREGERYSVVLATAGRLRERVVETVAIPVRVVALEGRVVPVGVEGRLELLQQARRGDSGQPNVPLDSLEQGTARQVRRTDVGRVEAGIAPEEPCLGVEAGAQRVVLDLHLGAELADEPIESGALGGTHVGGGDDAEPDASLGEATQLRLENPDAVPFDERAQEVDSIGALSSARSSAPRDGSPCAFVRSAASESGVVGRVSPMDATPGRDLDARRVSCCTWSSRPCSGFETCRRTSLTMRTRAAVSFASERARTITCAMCRASTSGWSASSTVRKDRSMSARVPSCRDRAWVTSDS